MSSTLLSLHKLRSPSSITHIQLTLATATSPTSEAVSSVASRPSLSTTTDPLETSKVRSRPPLMTNPLETANNDEVRSRNSASHPSPLPQRLSLASKLRKSWQTSAAATGLALRRCWMDMG